MDEIEEIEYSSENEYDVDYNISTDTSVNIEDKEIFKQQYLSDFKKNISTPYLTVYEKTRILCMRTQQIEDGSIPYIPNVERFSNAYSIALEEFNERKIPFIIRRPLPNIQGYEYLKLTDMIY
tara:strand:+ start:1026 stop:1394 length:369 start_codon:yes stop_codon:yes gene_type:complete